MIAGRSNIYSQASYHKKVITYTHLVPFVSPGARPINEISIEFEIRPKFAVLWLKINSNNHNEILHTSQ